jgi:hypothetical protein
MGFGAENNRISKTHPTIGVEFWDTDNFHLPNFKLADEVVPQVLISGGGDGALQDYLRVLSKPDLQGARPIFEACGIPKRLAARIGEDQAAVDRQLKWGCKTHHDCRPLRWLHKRFVKVIDRILADSDVRANVQTVLREPLPEVLLTYPCTHFGHVYALNRLLVLLLARYLAQYSEPPRRETLAQGYKLEVIGGDGTHQCDGKKWRECHAEQHIYTLAPADCALSPMRGPPRQGAANVIIIRHGVAPVLPQPLAASRSAPTVRRHILPYGLFRLPEPVSPSGQRTPSSP